MLELEPDVLWGRVKQKELLPLAKPFDILPQMISYKQLRAMMPESHFSTLKVWRVCKIVTKIDKENKLQTNTMRPGRKRARKRKKRKKRRKRKEQR